METGRRCKIERLIFQKGNGVKINFWQVLGVALIVVWAVYFIYSRFIRTAPPTTPTTSSMDCPTQMPDEFRLEDLRVNITWA
jgi:hypothetical protein